MDQFYDLCYFTFVNDLPNVATNLFSELYAQDTDLLAS